MSRCSPSTDQPPTQLASVTACVPKHHCSNSLSHTLTHSSLSPINCSIVSHQPITAPVVTPSASASSRHASNGMKKSACSLACLLCLELTLVPSVVHFFLPPPNVDLRRRPHYDRRRARHRCRSGGPHGCPPAAPPSAVLVGAGARRCVVGVASSTLCVAVWLMARCHSSRSYRRPCALGASARCASAVSRRCRRYVRRTGSRRRSSDRPRGAASYLHGSKSNPVTKVIHEIGHTATPCPWDSTRLTALMRDGEPLPPDTLDVRQAASDGERGGSRRHTRRMCGTLPRSSCSTTRSVRA